MMLISCIDSANFTLLVASENGVYSVAINGSFASQIGGQSSVESNGRLYLKLLLLITVVEM